jgi:hypothetical protein
MQPEQTTALDRTFEHARSNLKHALDEACRADISRADTGELIRVEEVLAIANEAAKEAISLRRRMAAERRPAPTPTAPAAPSTSREIEDTKGVRWAILEVRPTSSGLRPSVRERFRDGWLAFDSGVETRRVTPIPDNWQGSSDAELLAFLDAAEVVRHRVAARTTPAAGLQGPI